MATGSESTRTPSVNNNAVGKPTEEEKMQVESVAEASCSGTAAAMLRVPSPMILVSEDSEDQPSQPQGVPQLPPQGVQLTPTRDRKKSSGTSPRQRKRSQPVRGDLLPDPDKLLSYKHHDKQPEEELEDPSVPGGQPKPPPEPRQAGQAAERKRSTVTFCPVIQTIEK